MKFYKFFILSFLTTIILNCNHDKVFEYKYELELSEDKIFILDSETVQTTSIIQLFTQNDTLFFSFANEYDNSVVIYDYFSGDFITKIKFEKEGPNGVGNFTSYYYHSIDSIFIYHQMYGKISILNNFAIKHKEFNFNVRSLASSELDPPSLFPVTRSPMRKVCNFMVYTGVQASQDKKKQRPTTALYDLNTNEIKFANNLPELYGNYNWGNLFAYNCACTTFNNNTMVLSFGADHNILVYNIETDENSVFIAKTKHFSKIRPFHLLDHMDRLAEDNHYMNNLCYRNILYDEYRNLFYRFAFLPYPKYNKEERYLRRPFSVIILDSKFNVVGETLLPEFEYLISQTFVSPDGLHIQILSDDDDLMIFKTFNINKF